ncbi:MAG: glycosyltransferase family 39 protein [Proteobacteria bacterium]|nr:glycosyltransferase family 39 protein [Pseudomonadota bacterium]
MPMHLKNKIFFFLRYPSIQVVLPLILFAAFILWTIPLGSILEIVHDEEYELMKAFMWMNGFPLYQKIWNDQPPLHTLFLMELFRIFGPSVLAARLLALGFALLLLGSLMECVRRSEGIATAVLAGICLFIAPLSFRLFLSAILEVPTFSVIMLSAVLLYKWRLEGRRFWLIASGLAAGISLMIKLTSALFLPGLGLEILYRVWKNSPADRFRRLIITVLCWGFPILFVVGVTILFFPGMSVDQLLVPHFSKVVYEASDPSMKFSISLWLSSFFYLLLPACIGVVLRGLSGRLFTLRLPLFWFGTVFVAHYLHRPFWGYYFLHFAIPIAWLAAVGFKELFHHTNEAFEKAHISALYRHIWIIILSITFVLTFTKGGYYCLQQWQSIRSSQKIHESVMVKVLQKYKSRIHWVYSQRLCFPFYARVKIPPELVVLSFKRRTVMHWTQQDIIRILEHYIQRL